MESNIYIKINFLPGTDIKDAIKEAIEKCKEWNVSLIEFNFNGIVLHAAKNSLFNDVYSEYNLKTSKEK